MTRLSSAIAHSSLKADGSFQRLRSIVRDPEFRKVKESLKGLNLTTVRC